MADSIKILGVRVDRVEMDDAVNQILQWIGKSQKRTVFTPNIEFIMSAQEDIQFYTILNNSNLSVPDSARFSWALTQMEEKSKFKKILLWFCFPISKFPGLIYFPTVPGVDLMDRLCMEASVQGFTVGFLGGKNGVADKLSECLIKRYPGLKISYSGSGGVVNQDGSSDTLDIPKLDILFVAFGHVKQEKWIEKHQGIIPATVFMGVGGAFDYLSGSVPRAPLFLRSLGLEWLFRLIIQPWRIRRFFSLIEFVFHFLP